jgi:hypothetical protein
MGADDHHSADEYLEAIKKEPARKNGGCRQA